MITSTFISGNQDISEPLAIRREVFIKEQGAPETEEYDGLDEMSIHLIVYIDEAPAATGRILHDGKNFRIGRLAVLKKFRGQKIGDLALRLLLYKTFQMGADSIHISAQTYTIPFYEKFGFKVCSEEFMEAGIPHKKMKVGKDEVVYPSDCGSDHKKQSKKGNT